jgi:uncharacterized membrane protein (UPF0127 family)
MQSSSPDKSTGSTRRKLPFWILVVLSVLTAAVTGVVLAMLFLDWAGTHRQSPKENRGIPAVAAVTEALATALPKTLAQPDIPAPHVANFSQIKACIISPRTQLQVTMYLANSDELRAKGLQGIPGLPAKTGMLFVYEKMRSAEARFWMHKTLMNLDIAYLDAGGRIRTIQQMPSCDGPADSCPSYPAGVPFLAAAEFPQGFFRQHSITVGDRISADYFSDCQSSD